MNEHPPLAASEWRKQIVGMHDRSQLLQLLSISLQTYNFAGISIKCIDRHTGTYYPFLIDTPASLSECKALPNTRAPLEDPMVSEAMTAEKSFIVALETLVNAGPIPSWVRLKYDAGIRHAVVTPLRIKNETIGICYTWSDTRDRFCAAFIDVMDALSAEIGQAVLNTMVNEMLKPREWLNEQLLSFSNNLARVKDREDLQRTIASGLRNLIHFDECMIAAFPGRKEDDYIFLSSLSSQPGEPDLRQPSSFFKYLHKQGSVVDCPVIVDLDSGDSGECICKILPGAADTEFCLILLSNNKNTFDAGDKVIIQSISGHLATTISNILSNEVLAYKEKERSLLLSFSHNIATVRNKEELTQAIEKAVSSLSSITRYVIRIISEDQQTQSLYIYDNKVKKTIEKEGYQFVLDAVYPVNDNVSNVVLAGNETIVYNLQDWIDQGKAPSYFNFWRSMGVEKCVATPLRAGNRNLGIFWVDSDDPNFQLLDSMCAQISIAMSNILANEELLKYKRQLEIENEHLQEQIKSIYNSSEIIGSSEPMQKIYELMSLVAPSNATVLIGGETGTGKELIARGIHEASSRKEKIMVKINCAALPANLIEAELFGHERGAFTGALERRIGKFELANNGTIFLDEIGELPLELQVKLLRVIQEREVERIGGKATVKLNVRIIAATNRDLLSEVGAGRFRSDLYYRLNVFPILLPPLRQRPEDIPDLAHFFLAKYNKNHLCRITGISAATMQELKSYHWPGNVRELEHMIERSVLLSSTGILKKIYLPAQNDEHIRGIAPRPATLEDAEKRHIMDSIRRCGGKIAGKGGAAELLKIPASTLNSKMKKLGITRNLTID